MERRMAGGYEFRVSVASSSVAADLTVLLEDSGPFEAVAVSTDWFAAADPADAFVPFVLIAAENRWSRSAGHSKTDITPWKWAGSIIRKGPRASQQAYQFLGDPLSCADGFSLGSILSLRSSVPSGHAEADRSSSGLPYPQRLQIKAGYKNPCASIIRKGPRVSKQTNQLLGGPLSCADGFLLGFIFSLRSSVLSWHAEADRFRSGLPLSQRLQIRAGYKNPCASNSIESRGKKSNLSHKNPEQDRFQIFIRTLSGETMCKHLWTGIQIKNLKEEIQAETDIPSNLLNLIYAGKILQENLSLQHYGIGRDSSIILSSRLSGGSSGAGPKGFQGSTSKPTGSYRDAAKGKTPLQEKEQATFNISPGQYIVDQTPENPSISLDYPEVKGVFTDLENKAVICRFNGFWPKSESLYQWIHTVWTKDCQIHLCSKGFFIVTFQEDEERDKILHEGPWFWGNAGLFVTPWFPEFDANTMVASRMPVWVRMHNLPLHFWHFKSLTAIGNSLGRMLKIDTDRHLKGIFTFARICVEVDLSQGLPESVILTFNNTQWKQPLDYENTAFRCRGCQQTGHLLKACPSKSKPQQRKPRGWQNLDEVLKRRTARKKAPPVSKEEETEVEEDDTTTEEDETENQKENPADNKDQQPHTNQVETQQDRAEATCVELSMGGNKRQHQSDTSDSDKESGKLKETTQLVIAMSEPPLGEWRKIEKKKGRKS